MQRELRTTKKETTSVSKKTRLNYDEMDLVATYIIKSGRINYTESGKMIHDNWTSIAKDINNMRLIPSLEVSPSHILSAIKYFEASTRHRKVPLPIPPADHKELVALKEQVARLLKDQEKSRLAFLAIAAALPGGKIA